jgi:hypothetical protein
MHSRICTIGFAGKTAEEFFRLLQEARVLRVVDIRENRIGQLAGFAKFPDIAFFLDRIGGISYAHELLLAPSVEIRKAYRGTHDWTAYETSFHALMRERRVPEAIRAEDFEGTVALLCSEPGPEKCHRRLVGDLLAEYWRSQGHTVEVEHLQSASPPKKMKRRKRRGTNDDRAHPE